MLRQPLLLIMGACAAAALLFSATASQGDAKRSEAFLHRFTWVEKSGKNGTLRVCWSVLELNCSGPFQLTYAYTSMFSVNSDVFKSDNSQPHLCCGDFVVDTDTLDYTDEQIYMVNSDEIYAVAQFRMSIEPAVLNVEILQAAEIIRVGPMSNFTLNVCGDSGETFCYLNGTTPPDQLCTYSPDLFQNKKVFICDSTFLTQTIDNETELVDVMLFYDNSTVEVSTSIDENANLEVFIFNSLDDAWVECEGSTCLVDDASGNSVYNLLMVELYNNSYAISSNHYTVLDMNMSSMWLSPDSLRVSWTGPRETYTVTLGKDGAVEDERSIECVDCAELFIHLSETQLQVTVKQANSHTSIVASVTGDPPQDVPGKLSSMNHNVNYADPSTVFTEVCVDQTFGNASVLFIVDVNNRTSTSEFSETDGSWCSSVKMAATADIVRVLVTGTSDGVQQSTQADLYFFLPKLERLTPSSARATWTNLNFASSYSLSSPAVDEEALSELECIRGTTCRYYVEASSDNSNNTVILTENADITQTCTTSLEELDVAALTLDTELRTRYDNRLLVCYDPGSGSSAHEYELGMEREEELVVSNQQATVDQSSGELCLVTSKPVLLGAYVTLWAVVAEFNSHGDVTRSGEGIFIDLYLSEDSGVYALVEDANQASGFNLHCSWKLVDDTENLDHYTVILENETGGQVVSPESLPVNVTTHTFSEVPEGRYTICVVVSGDGFASERVCSDIIQADSPEGGNSDTIPVVSELHYLINYDNSVKISWSMSEEELEGATAFLIEYSKNTKYRKNEKALLRTPLRHETLLHYYHNGRDLSDDTDFQIIPATQSSVDLPLIEGIWQICVSAMKDNRGGTQTCSDAEVGSEHIEVPAPEDLNYDEGSKTLTWDLPTDVPSAEAVSYYIEAKRPRDLKAAITADKHINISAFVGTGEWTVSVQTVEEEHLSSTTSMFIVSNGIEITAQQTGNREMKIAWSEFNSEQTGDPKFYTVSFGLQRNYGYGCADLCDMYFTDTSEEAGENIEISVKNEESCSEEQATASFYDITSVEHLSSSSLTTSSATISWRCVEEATLYNVSLYDSATNEIKYNDRTTICSHTFGNPSLGTITGDLAKVQACVSASACGDPQTIKLEQPTENGGDDSDGLVIVLSVAGALVIVIIVGLITIFLIRRNKKSKSQKTTNGVELQESVNQNESSVSGDLTAPPAEFDDTSAAISGPALGVAALVPSGLTNGLPPAGPYSPNEQIPVNPPPRSRPPRLDPVPQRFDTRYSHRRPQSLSPERNPGHSNYEAQTASKDGRRSKKGQAPPPRPRRAPYHPSQHPAGPTQRSASQQEPQPRSSRRRGHHSAPHHSSHQPPPNYSSGPRPYPDAYLLSPPSGQPRSRYSGY